MIVGNGMMAKAMQNIDKNDYLFFCSGVSNSKETNEHEFIKERQLLELHLNTKRCLIYFSSYFVNFNTYLNERYYRHKYEMEQLIRDNCFHYKIFRVPQVVGHSSNPKTLTNFLHQSIKEERNITIYTNAERNLLDIDDIVSFVDYSNQNQLFSNKTLNLLSTSNSAIEDIISVFETITGKQAKKNYVQTYQQPLEILLSDEVRTIYHALNIDFEDGYLENVVQKYYQ